MTRNLIKVFEKCLRTLELDEVEKQALSRQIHHHRALLGLFEGKRALSAGGANAALVHFEKANEELRSSKLSVVVFFLRHAPLLVIWAYRTRGRLLVKHSKNEVMGLDTPRPAQAAEPAGKTNASEYTT
jgi:hypothetical protein